MQLDVRCRLVGRRLAWLMRPFAGSIDPLTALGSYLSGLQVVVNSFRCWPKLERLQTPFVLHSYLAVLLAARLLDQADHLVVQPVAAFERHSYPDQRLVQPTDLVVETRLYLIVQPIALPKCLFELVAGQFARLVALRLILADRPVEQSVLKAGCADIPV